MSLNKWAIKQIKRYQINKSTSGRCKHYPCCSDYGIECFNKFNFLKASFLTTKRIISCNPLTKKTYDPVPLNKKEKKIYQLKINKLSYFKDMLLNEKLKYPNMELNDFIIFCYLTTFPKINNSFDSTFISEETLNEKITRYFYSESLKSYIYSFNSNDFLFSDELFDEFYLKIDIFLQLIRKKKLTINFKRKHIKDDVFSYLSSKKDLVISENYLKNKFTIIIKK